MHSSARALFRSVVVGLAFAGLSAGAAAQQKFVNILTGGQSGVYYPLGVALGQIYGKAMPDAKTSVQATKASVENLNLLQAGRGEIAFTLGDSLSDAWKGDEEAGFKTPLEEAAHASPGSTPTTSRSSPAPTPASRRWPTSRASASPSARRAPAPN